jgi:drug/metabolite transporter (DMT)-like permease
MLGFVFLDERIAPATIIGAALVLCGVATALTGGRAAAASGVETAARRRVRAAR